VEHRHGNTRGKANGVTFEAGLPAEHEVYFAISDSTVFRAPAMTLTNMGGVEIKGLDKKFIARAVRGAHRAQGVRGANASPISRRSR
jgi:succinyl-CoA synthetase beta subunit